MTPATRGRAGWTFVVTSIALFMVTLDNLVVSTALPVIRVDLGASIESLQWTVNAYTLAYAVFLLTGAALGDRFGRRRMFILGVALFAAASAAAALAPTADALIVARAVQGLGAAFVTPLSLTLLSDAVPGAPARPRDRRVVRRRRPRRRARARRRRRDRRRPLLALDLLGQRADRPRAAPASHGACSPRAAVRTARSTRAASCSRAPACSA